MILIIAVALFASMLVEAYTNPDRCPDYSRALSRKASASEITRQSWYHEQAYCRVAKGIFTVELLSNGSMPKSLEAESKGIVELERGFAEIQLLESLSLEDNLIQSIDSFAFEGLPQLVHLNLARNRISHLVKDSFAGLSKLEILKLNDNALSAINFSISSKTLPALRELHLQDNQLDFIDVTHGEKMCDSNIEHLHLSNNSLRWIGLQNSPHLSCLRNLTHLFLEHNYLTEVNYGNIPLQALSLDGNHIRNIPAITPKLKFLSLARNNIRDVGNLKNGENIVYLVLSYNTFCWDQIYSPRFNGLLSLEHLALDHNLMRSIPDGLFSNMPSLQSIDLSDNKISHISPTAFASLLSLRDLHLDNNDLSSFPGRPSFGNSILRYLDLSNNKVEKVSNLEANMIPKLKVLKLTGNPLKRMEPYSVSRDVDIIF